MPLQLDNGQNTTESWEKDRQTVLRQPKKKDVTSNRKKKEEEEKGEERERERPTKQTRDTILTLLYPLGKEIYTPSWQDLVSYLSWRLLPESECLPAKWSDVQQQQQHQQHHFPDYQTKKGEEI